MKQQELPNHIKDKILMFFLETSVPRIIKEEREKEAKKVGEAVGS